MQLFLQNGFISHRHTNTSQATSNITLVHFKTMLHSITNCVFQFVTGFTSVQLYSSTGYYINRQVFMDSSSSLHFHQTNFSSVHFSPKTKHLTAARISFEFIIKASLLISCKLFQDHPRFLYHFKIASNSRCLFLFSGFNSFEFALA